MDNCFPRIHYSIGGMAQYYNSPLDVLSYGIDPDIWKIVVNTSVQPNSIPHFGTITTFMGAFVLTQMAKDEFNRDAAVEIDFVDCGPTADYHQHGGARCLSIARTPYDEKSDVSIADFYIADYYIPLLDWIASRSGVKYTIRRYREFQLEPSVREAVIKICQDPQLERLLSPKSGKLHIRTECPNCGAIDKQMKGTYVSVRSKDCLAIRSSCSIHGAYEIELRETNSAYFEANTQIRDIVKGALMQAYRRRHILGVLYDGGDWGGTWTHHVHCIALQRLGYSIPIRIFAPLILDWSGGKLSKSIYRKSQKQGVDSLENYECFLSTYGERGLETIYDEVSDWLSASNKFFRNYSVDYILEILRRGKKEGT